MTVVGVDIGSVGLRAGWTDGATGPHRLEPVIAATSWVRPIVGTAAVSFRTVKDLLLDGPPPSRDSVDADTAVVLDALRSSRETATTAGSRIADRLVMTVPTQAGTAGRTNLRELGRMAGFDEVHIVNDVVALVVPEIREGSGPARTILVYSMGYRATEIGLVRVLRRQLRVLGHATSPLGGARLDEWVLSQWSAKAGYGLAGTADDWAAWRIEAEDAKLRLVAGEVAPWTAPGGQRVEIPADVFREQVREGVAQTLDRLDEMLQEAEVRLEEIDSVILAGGSTAIPDVAGMLRERLDLEPVRAEPTRPADGAAAYGRTLGRQTASPLLEDSHDQAAAPVGAWALPLRGGAGTAGDGPIVEAERLAAVGRVNEATAILRGVRDQVDAALARIGGTSPSPGAAAPESAAMPEKPTATGIPVDEIARARRALKRSRRALQRGRLQEAVSESHAGAQVSAGEHGLYEEMIEIHLDAAARSSSDEKAVEWLGCAHFHDRDDARVRSALAERWMSQARRAARAGDKAAARQVVDRCLDMDPEHEDALALKKSLQEDRSP